MTDCFNQLPTEIIIQIFEYCDIPSLCCLERACVRFYEIIKKATNLGNSSPILVTNQLRQEIRNRSFELLTFSEKRRISHNWKNGKYQERFLLKEKTRCMPHLILTKDELWISKNNSIYAYQRKKYYLDVKKPIQYVQVSTSDVCKFVLKENCIISGQRDGSIFTWNLQNNFKHLQILHESDVHSVDVKDDLLVSGSKDKTFKIWLLQTELDQPYVPVYTHNMNDRIWSMALSNKSSLLAIGTAGHFISPLHIFDVNRYTVLLELGKDFYKGSGIFDLKWENPHILLSGGYDKTIRKWDMRTGTFEQSWEDPFYSPIYSFETDNYCTLLTGTQSHGRVVLWDTRTKYYVQMYFMETCKNSFSSPIYSLSFDSMFLFTGTDYFLNILNFGKRRSCSKNYRLGFII